MKNYNLIEDGLYLGNLLTTSSSMIMNELKIKVVITAMGYPIFKKLDGIEYHFIELFDIVNEDIVSHFPFAYNIISKAQQEGKNVYVHCQAGVSRSATIVISFLMKKYEINYEKALLMVKKSRRKVNPNCGFICQLELYENWGYQLDGRNKDYRKHVINYLIYKYSNSNGFSLRKRIIVNAFINYFSKMKQVDDKLSESEKENKYLCKFCRNLLFHQINLMQTEVDNNNCDKLFIEPQEWMMDQIRAINNFNKESIIKCLKCRNKIGNFAFETFTCSCFLHQEFSGYFIVKIDKDIVMRVN